VCLKGRKYCPISSIVPERVISSETVRRCEQIEKRMKHSDKAAKANMLPV
jgi:hypothetical protein